jgi:hypothetical protein
MSDNDLIIGHIIRVTGMIGVLAGIFLFTAGLLFLIFRYSFDLDILSMFRGFW